MGTFEELKEEDLPNFRFPIEDKSKKIIKVIGVGGGGGNAVQHMMEEGIKNVTLVVVNTDSQALKANAVPNKIQLGDGLGTGGDPVLGCEIAEKNIDNIRSIFDDDTKMVFIVAGMGGGTGTGVAPVIARVAKEMGILTVGVVTLPFKMELKKRIDKALKGMNELKKCVDSLIVINNQKLLENEQYCDLPAEDGLKKADEVLTVATRTIADIITYRGVINRDYNDVRTVMKDGGAALVSVAKASGEKRVLKAMSEAISLPLIANVDIQQTQRMLYIVYSSKDKPAKIRELSEIAEFMGSFDENIEVLWGHYRDDSLGDEVKVSIIVTGFDKEATGGVDEQKDSEEKSQTDWLRDKYYGSMTINSQPVNVTNEADTAQVDDEIVTNEEASDDINTEEEPEKHPVLKRLLDKLGSLMEE